MHTYIHICVCSRSLAAPPGPCARMIDPGGSSLATGAVVQVVACLLCFSLLSFRGVRSGWSAPCENGVRTRWALSCSLLVK